VRRRLRLFVIASIVLSSLSLTSVSRRAHAANAKADELVNQAVELRRNGDDEGALPLLVQAYALGRTPRATGQLGLCEQALGRWADAEVYVTEALKAESDPWVKKNRRALEDALVIVKSHIARVEIQGDPDGAEIWVNGALAGKLPLAVPVRVAAGEVEIELRAPGYVREAKTLRLEAGQYQHVVLRASKEPAPASLASPPEATAMPPVAASAPSSAGVDKDKAPESEAQGHAQLRPALKWIAWGLGAAALGVGVYGAAENASEVSSFNTTCRIDQTGAAIKKDGSPSTTCPSQKSAYETKSTIAVAGFVTAGALAAAGVVLWLTEPSARANGTAALACAPALGEHLAPALGCALRF
jgi:hypothetical protein